MARRTFTASVAGICYEIPTTMAVLRAGEEASGASLIESVAENKMAAVLQGVLFAGLEALGVTEIGEGEDARPLSYEAVGELCDFAETTTNYMAFVTAMSPISSGERSKNASAEGSGKGSRGGKSSDTATDSSS